MNTDLSFAFFGTPDVASKTLELLAAAGYIPKIIVTSPDRPSGRGMQCAMTPVAQWAEAHSIICLKPEKITPEFLETLDQYSIDLSIVVAYGKILPQALIEKPALGTLNIHYSLLPHYRGASPVEEALLQGDAMTGIAIQQMAYKLDTGALLAIEEVPITITHRKLELRERLIKIGGDLLVKTLPDIIAQKIIPTIQDESQATYCTKIKKEDGEIDPAGNAFSNYNKYRAYEGWPGVSFFVNKKGKRTRIKITAARYENNSFIIERVVPEGKKEIMYTEFLKNLS